MTLQDALIEREMPVDPAGYDCPGCRRRRPAWAIQSCPDMEDIRCTDCEIDRQRVVVSMREIAEAGRKSAWETPQADWVRAERNRRIETARWAVDPLTSPLTESCQAQWLEYIRTLNRITVDFSNPADVTWPEQPTLEYP